MKSPSYPLLDHINTRIWLTELSRKIRRRASLDKVSGAQLDRLARTSKLSPFH
jgi:hypothetical protein